MIDLLLLPFRGLIWLVLGSIFSLPWLIIALPFTTNYWLPHALSYGFECKTHALCKIEKASIDWKSSEITLRNVSIFNPSDFNTADCMKFRTIQFQLDLTSLLGACIHVTEMSFDCQQMNFVKQNNVHNFLALGKLFSGDKRRNFIVDSLNFKFKGFVSIKSYDSTFVRSMEFFTQKNFSFSNVCNNVQFGQSISTDPVRSLESVYNVLGTLFKNERTL